MNSFVDANVIIKAFIINDDREKCKGIIKEDFVTDTLCLIEAQDSITLITKDKIYASECIKSIFKSSAQIVEIDKNILFEAFKRIEKYNLNIFDLVHYVAALKNECTEFVSYDRDFDRLEIKRTEP